MSKVIVLGAKGRFGNASVTAFLNAGWEVTAFGRAWNTPPVKGVTYITGDATDVLALTDACAGHDVIVNAVNPGYVHWARVLPVLTDAVLTAARRSGATLILPGNVYNYGANAGETLTERTPMQPTSRKGQMCVTLEQAYRQSGLPVIVIRGGDFIEKPESGIWFDAHIAAKAHQGRTMYPGPLDRTHAWTYTPDMARAAVMLAERRETLERFAEFGFQGYTLTGAQLVQNISQATGKKQKTSGFPWWAIPVLGLFSPLMREVYEMRYLWRVPHRLDGSKLAQVLPDFKVTPVEVAMKEALGS